MTSGSAEQDTLNEIRAMIDGLSEDNRIRTQAIAMTFRNILKDDPLAQLALALIGAEMAALS